MAFFPFFAVRSSLYYWWNSEIVDGKFVSLMLLNLKFQKGERACFIFYSFSDDLGKGRQI